MLRHIVLVTIGLMILAGCAGKSQDSYTDNTSTTYADQPPVYYEYPSSPGMTPLSANHIMRFLLPP